MARIRITKDDLAQHKLYEALKKIAQHDVNGDPSDRQAVLAELAQIESGAKPGLIDRLAVAVEADSDAYA